MLAHEIGSIHPQAIPKIVEAMDQCHCTSLENHLEKYILEPLRSLNRQQPLVIIIDAMDEWRDHPTFIKALAHLNSQSHVVKFFITDRLNPCASHLPGIEKISIRTYALGPISKEVIKTYFHKHLETVPWEDGRMATPSDVDKLTELSGGLPVWAATVIGLLSHRLSESPPHEILEEIVGSRRQVGGSDGLGELYCNALLRLFRSPEDQRQLRRYLGASIGLQEALSPFDFSMLAEIRTHLINRIQFDLSALQTRSPPLGSEGMVHPATTLFHMSFLEYVQATTTESSFSISTLDSHSTLGLSCLKQLTGLPSSSHHVSDLYNHQHYAMKYWPFHVFKGTPRSHERWSQTEHCSTLRKITAETQRQWAALFLESLVPGKMDTTMMDNIGSEDGMVSILSKLANSLDKIGQDCWEFQVACLEVAIRIDDGDAEVWSQLGKCYKVRGSRTGILQMHEEAVVAFQHALHIQTNRHPDHAKSLNNIAAALMSCYKQNGDRDILSKAISCHQEALALRPAPHPDRSTSLNNLAIALQSLYRCNGSIGTLTEVISLHREALGLRPQPHPARPISLNNLAFALRCQFDQNGSVDVLNEAISLWRELLALHPPGHRYQQVVVHCLAELLEKRYEVTGDNQDKGEIEHLKTQLALLHQQEKAKK
ncbi:hypothetical protein H1R20_g2112, partial [Candolleomyces eurysporus]